MFAAYNSSTMLYYTQQERSMKIPIIPATVLMTALFLSSCATSVRFSSGGASYGGASSGSSSSGGSDGGAGSPSESSDSERPPQNGATFRGLASYYAEKFHGRATSSGEVYDMNSFTAAHRSLPFGTTVQVRNLRNNRVVMVRINDRGPQKTERIIDLSKAAAESIDMTRAGVVEVEIKVLR